MTRASTPVRDHRYLLGEGAGWDPARQVAYWVDIDRGHAHTAALDGAHLGDPTTVYRSAQPVSAMTPATDGGWLIADGRSLQHVREDGSLGPTHPVIPASIASRLNDGATDPAGRYLIGSIALDDRRHSERLWRLDTNGEMTVLDDDLTISNGLAWSPDGATMYSIDSGPGDLWQRNYDPDSGHVGPRHLLRHFADGTPDGLTVDADGTLWIAMWGQGEIRAYLPDGRQTDRIATGAPLTTSCAFIGADLSTLLITSAAKHVDGFASTFEAGMLQLATLPTPGTPAAAWQPPSTLSQRRSR